MNRLTLLRVCAGPALSALIALASSTLVGRERRGVHAHSNHQMGRLFTATAWATGHKTSNGRISTSAGDDRDFPTILELAQQRGYRTGDVTTAELTDATPAVLASHVAHRSCQGPTDMALCPQDRKSAGGPGSIAEQLIDHHVDVMMGGGYSRFEQPTDAGPQVVQLTP
jgi:alkaline phosphatase